METEPYSWKSQINQQFKVTFLDVVCLKNKVITFFFNENQWPFQFSISVVTSHSAARICPKFTWERKFNSVQSWIFPIQSRPKNICGCYFRLRLHARGWIVPGFPSRSFCWDQFYSSILVGPPSGATHVKVLQTRSFVLSRRKETWRADHRQTRRCKTAFSSLTLTWWMNELIN